MTEELTFQNVLEHLSGSTKDIPHKHLRMYSDLDPKSIRLFSETWRNITPKRKNQLLEKLLAELQNDTLVSYEEIGRALLNDAEEEVRACAIRLLTESTDARTADSLTDILLLDLELSPRLEAAKLLGKYILLGELEEIGREQQSRIENALITTVKGEDHAALRKAALESLGFSSHAEVYTLIESAYERPDPTWVASALRAMGRTHDEERWRDEVLGKLLDEDPRIQVAAVEAAGELELEEAALVIIQILEDEEIDDEVVAAGIWSLSQIGGEDARVYLVNLVENTEDEDVLEYLEDALENLEITQMGRFEMFDLENDADLEDDEEDEGK